MTNSVSTPLGFPIEKLYEAKGRGILQSVSSKSIIEDKNTVVDDKSDSVIVTPQGENFLVLIKPNKPFKEKQTVTIMSKFVLKSLRNAINAPEPQVLRNPVINNDDFRRKWNSRDSRQSRY